MIICGNHANQFIDPMMIMANTNREISFTMAASSYSKPVVGQLAKALKVIPVHRPEDHKKQGTGKIRFESENKISVSIFSKKNLFNTKNFFSQYLI